MICCIFCRKLRRKSTKVKQFFVKCFVAGFSVEMLVRLLNERTLFMFLGCQHAIVKYDRRGSVMSFSVSIEFFSIFINAKLWERC